MGFQLSLNSSNHQPESVTANVAGLVLPGTDPSGVRSRCRPRVWLPQRRMRQGPLQSALTAYNSANGTTLALPSNYS